MSLDGAGQGILHGICKPFVLSSASIADHSITSELTFNSALCSRDIASSFTTYMCQGHSVCHLRTATVEPAGCVSSRKTQVAIMVLFITRHITCKPYAGRQLEEMKEA
jgi:hypothetical protein